MLQEYFFTVFQVLYGRETWCLIKITAHFSKQFTQFIQTINFIFSSQLLEFY
jgi:hypothetical protein